MSASSNIARRWKPIVVAVLFGAGEAFCINKVSADNPSWWWWLLLVAALVGVIGCGLWALFIEPDEKDVPSNNVAGDVKKGGKVTQQSTGEKGRNGSVSADNGSFAAYRVDKIEDLTIGQARRPPDSEKPK